MKKTAADICAVMAALRINESMIYKNNESIMGFKKECMMSSDCTVPLDNGLINLRVGAIIMKNGKFLMAGNDRQDYLYSVGGRIKFGETAEEAVVREVFEETGIQMEIDRLGFVQEVYFYGASPAKRGKLVYEISFFFYMNTPENFEPEAALFAEDGSKEKLVWADSETKTKYYPAFFREELKNPCHTIKHFLTDERKTI